MNPHGTFILVDDDLTNNILCGAVLRKTFENPDVKTFQVPEEALKYIKENFENSEQQQATLFLDINMPTMTGWEFLDEFKALPETIRKKFIIYVLSSSVDRKDVEKASENEFVKDYIQKPLRKESLKTLLSGQG